MHNVTDPPKIKSFPLSSLVPSLMAGLVVSVMVVVVSVSLATLIFSGELAPFLGKAVGLVLFTGMITTGVVALFSSYPGMIGYPTERVAPVLALMAASIAGANAGGDPEMIFLTVVAALSFAAFFNGAVLLLLGGFKLGSLIRFIPYPVVGGFLAGTGFLLVKGSIGVMTGLPVTWEQAPALLEGITLAKWISGALLGTLMVWAIRQWKHFTILPASIVGGTAVFFAVAGIFQATPDSLQESGWLLGPFAQTQSWEPLSWKAFQHTDWSFLINEAGNFASIVFISVVSLLLNSGALELVVKRDIDLNRELKTAGFANLIIGVGGGTIGFHSLSTSRLAHGMGASSRLTGLTACGICALLLLVGPQVLAFSPRCVVGALLFFLGTNFLIEWVVKSYSRMARSDYAVVLVILVCIGFSGYLFGTAVGLVVCIILFLVNYSGVEVVKHAMSGAERQSNVERPRIHELLLRSRGKRNYVFILQGYIFFGTANRLLVKVRERLEDPELPPVRILFLDFKHIAGIDSSSIISLIKMRQVAERLGVTLCFTAVSPIIRRKLRLEQFDDVSEAVLRYFDDLDHGLEWAENAILEEAGIEAEATGVRTQLKDFFPDLDAMETLLSYFSRKEFPAGELIARQGQLSTSLYLLDSGQISAVLTLNNGNEVRLRTFQPGSIVGEIGLVLESVRSASLRAQTSVVVYELTRESLQKMTDQDSKYAANFERLLNRLMAERLTQTNALLRVVME